MYAWLAETRNLTPADIGTLTPVQIVAIYLPDRDKDGRIKFDVGGDSDGVDVAEQLRLRNFRLGLPPTHV